MMRLFPWPAICVLSLTLGCDSYDAPGVPGSGAFKTESRTASPFTAIEFEGAGRLDVTIGDPASLEVTGDDNLLPLIETVVRDDRLIIRPLQKIDPTDEPIFTITNPDLRAIVLNGTATASIAGLNNDALRIDVRGAAAVSASGITGDLQISMYGTSSAQTDQLAARDVRVEITGAGSADVQASDSLDVAITGAGSVVYTGDPKVTRKVLGAGSIQREN